MLEMGRTKTDLADLVARKSELPSTIDFWHNPSRATNGTKSARNITVRRSADLAFGLGPPRPARRHQPRPRTRWHGRLRRAAAEYLQRSRRGHGGSMGALG